ncbi:MAG: hypothetical protein V1866_04265 [archaeon]
MVQFVKTQETEPVEEPEAFNLTSKYISDELDFIQSQQENIITTSTQLEKALSQAEQMKRFFKVMKKADKIMLETLRQRRKTESSMLGLIEDIKALLREKRYEDIDRLMQSVHRKSQEKIHLSQAQLHQLRDLMAELNELYNEAAGFCKLSQVLYAKLAQVHESCQEELNTELSEEEELSRAGAYAGSGDGKVVRSLSFKNLLGDGVSHWFNRY